jgi:hypothetical protein
VEAEFGLEPLSGHLFLFLNRRGHVAQILFWDRNALASSRNASRRAPLACVADQKREHARSDRLRGARSLARRHRAQRSKTSQALPARDGLISRSVPENKRRASDDCRCTVDLN